MKEKFKYPKNKRNYNEMNTKSISAPKYIKNFLKGN